MKDLRPLKTDFDRLLAEAQRTLQGEFIEMEGQCSTASLHARKANSRRNSVETALAAFPTLHPDCQGNRKGRGEIGVTRPIV